MKNYYLLGEDVELDLKEIYFEYFHMIHVTVSWGFQNIFNLFTQVNSYFLRDLLPF